MTFKFAKMIGVAACAALGLAAVPAWAQLSVADQDRFDRVRAMPPSVETFAISLQARGKKSDSRMTSVGRVSLSQAGGSANLPGTHCRADFRVDGQGDQQLLFDTDYDSAAIVDYYDFKAMIWVARSGQDGPSFSQNGQGADGHCVYQISILPEAMYQYAPVGVMAFDSGQCRGGSLITQARAFDGAVVGRWRRQVANDQWFAMDFLPADGGGANNLFARPSGDRTKPVEFIETAGWSYAVEKLQLETERGQSCRVRYAVYRRQK
ncbi:hypothetical protein [Parvularcula sp. LCG005]|uniref:hypothetical protein n=1 Tax=Parvularcula sp. LCG005 TaxID=3078805 RepID=UPI002942799C|nr:hypothetical protein [Parvularcula sp. LCG005]WOI53974.1 hypothetical protein RUI03_02970 [Parvularcula sp. LCG005]